MQGPAENWGLVKSISNPKAYSVSPGYTLFSRPLWEGPPPCSAQSHCSTISGSRVTTATQWGCCSRGEVTEQGTGLGHVSAQGAWGTKSRPPHIPVTDMGAHSVCSLKQWGHRRGTLRAQSSRVPMGSSCEKPLLVPARICLVRLST